MSSISIASEPAATAARDVDPGAVVSAADRPPGPRGRRSRPGAPQGLRTNALAWALLAATVAQLGLFVLWPLVGNAIVSTQDRRLTRRDAPGVGLENWRAVLAEGDVHRSLRFTLLYAVVVVVATVVVAMAAALALHDRPVLRRLTGNAIVLPIATSLSIAAVGWRLVFGLDGPINQVLDLVAVDGPNWLRDPATAPWVVILVGLWADTGLLFLLFSASLSRVPPSLVSAARVFGRWRGVVHKYQLFVPQLRRTIVVASVLATVSALQSFDQVLLLTDGGPDGVTRTLAFLAWERSFRFFDLGDGAVISMLLAAAIAVLAVAVSVTLRRGLRSAGGDR
ncbi:MAG: sugar ABC transporter permease [Actinomycetota bacterium]|nr:sugar ABC transporter permease [Actinomycetota bacterium]